MLYRTHYGECYTYNQETQEPHVFTPYCGREAHRGLQIPLYASHACVVLCGLWGLEKPSQISSSVCGCSKLNYVQNRLICRRKRTLQLRQNEVQGKQLIRTRRTSRCAMFAVQLSRKVKKTPFSVRASVKCGCTATVLACR